MREFDLDDGVDMEPESDEELTTDDLEGEKTPATSKKKTTKKAGPPVLKWAVWDTLFEVVFVGADSGQSNFHFTRKPTSEEPKWPLLNVAFATLLGVSEPSLLSLWQRLSAIERFKGSQHRSQTQLKGKHKQARRPRARRA